MSNQKKLAQKPTTSKRTTTKPASAEAERRRIAIERYREEGYSKRDAEKEFRRAESLHTAPSDDPRPQATIPIPSRVGHRLSAILGELQKMHFTTDDEADRFFMAAVRAERSLELAELDRILRRARGLLIVTREAVVNENSEIDQAVFEVSEVAIGLMDNALAELDAVAPHAAEVKP